MKKLTNLQFLLLQAIDHSEYGNSLNDSIWTFSILDNSDITARQLPGVIAGALKAGLIIVGNHESGPDTATVQMTEAGVVAYTSECVTQGLEVKKSF